MTIPRNLLFGASLCLLAAACGKTPPKPVSPTPAPEPTKVASAIRFEDVTKSSGVAFVHVNGAAGKKWMPETMGAGVAAFDADGDGRVDLLFVNGRYWPGDPRAARQPTLSFWRNVTEPGGPIRFEDRTKEAGLAVSLYGMGVAVGDVNDDGAPDLVITGLDDIRLFVNDGKGHFRDATKGSGLVGSGWGTSAAFADFDGDGVLDLFVGQYVSWTPKTDMYCSLDGRTKSYCTPERYNGVPSRLYKGLGGGKFREITKESGLVNPLGKALGVAVRDVNGDGRPDLVVANDTSPNNLFLNVETKNGIPRFKDAAIEAGVAVGEDGRARGAMGVAFGDTKNEGGVTLVVGNFSNEMWSVWSAGPKGDFFVDESVQSGIGRTSLLPLTFGVAFADFDLDGVLDLVGADGHVENSVQDVQPTVTYRQAPLLFRGLGAGRFADVTKQAGAEFSAPMVGRGLAVADFDGDGKPDLVLTENGGPAHVFRNVSEGAGNAVRLVLATSGKNRAAIGARVTCAMGGKKRVDEVSGGDGYLSVSDRTITLGLGSAAKLDAVDVRWPDGTTASAKDLAPGLYKWVEGAAPLAVTR
ncbi:MAG TPA: CRTAC1 family protein [Thermoanaerobaculia bacterium]|nr:CRTAC1 family protein [Thermoanaerobaculia bacterium]